MFLQLFSFLTPFRRQHACVAEATCRSRVYGRQPEPAPTRAGGRYTHPLPTERCECTPVLGASQAAFSGREGKGLHVRERERERGERDPCSNARETGCHVCQSAVTIAVSATEEETGWILLVFKANLAGLRERQSRGGASPHPWAVSRVRDSLLWRSGGQTHSVSPRFPAERRRDSP